MTRAISAVSLVLALAMTFASAEERKATLTTADSFELPLSTRVTPVLVTNFPLDEAGNLQVADQSTQPRQVEVVNLPATQQVAGQVNVANLPLDANGNLRVAIPGPRAFRFVGVTTQMFAGNAGRAAMTTACYAQFPGSRMAFSDEYANTVNPPPVVNVAWIQPRPSLAGQGTYNWYCWDAVGNSFSAELNRSTCDNWSSSSPDQSGALLDTAGNVTTRQGCDVQRPVACAAPE